jgi:DNA-binding LacI/PurR family transcriptional regulator
VRYVREIDLTAAEIDLTGVGSTTARRPRSRLKEVARLAGVSPATASRVLSGATTVRETNRAAVLAAAAELGYRPNHVGRNLRRQRADMIGVVVSDIENPHFSAMVRAVEDAAYHQGGRVLLCNTDEDPEKERKYLRVLASERVLGVVLSATDPDAREISELLDLGIPLVAFDRPVADPRADDVFIDNVAGGRLATEHLLRGGHRRIGFIGGPSGVHTANARRSGYESAMRAAGCAPVTQNGGFKIQGSRRATAELLGVKPPLTALVVANNLMSLGMLEELRVQDRLDEIATVTLDDPFWSTLVEPALTALAQPVRAMSARAVHLLFERMSGARVEPRTVVFDFELRIRDSCRTTPAARWRLDELRAGEPSS